MTAKSKRDAAPATPPAVPAALRLEAMSLQVPTGIHANKMPFSGVLTRVDQPSDAPPGGAGGRRIVLSREAAEAALPTLLGMGVNYTSMFDGHDPQAKIGVITAATIEGDAICIEGFIYAADFPAQAGMIKATKAILGFSFEAQDIQVEDVNADPLVITACTFTGAAILQRDKAAYTTTSLAAAAANPPPVAAPAASSEGEIEMNEELKKLFDALNDKLAVVASEVAGIKASAPVAPVGLAGLVEPHAGRLEEAAVELEKAGIGIQAGNGHAAILRALAADLRFEAAAGRRPVVYAGIEAKAAPAPAAPAPVAQIDAAAIGDSLLAKVMESLKPLQDQVASLGTKVADVQAAGVKEAPVPERKTVSPGVSALLAKHGIEMPEEGKKMPIASLDKVLAGTSMSLQDRFRIKGELSKAGVIA